jgi:hypothetical protein
LIKKLVLTLVMIAVLAGAVGAGNGYAVVDRAL